MPGSKDKSSNKNQHTPTVYRSMPRDVNAEFVGVKDHKSGTNYGPILNKKVNGVTPPTSPSSRVTPPGSLNLLNSSDMRKYLTDQNKVFHEELTWVLGLPGFKNTEQQGKKPKRALKPVDKKVRSKREHIDSLLKKAAEAREMFLKEIDNFSNNLFDVPVIPFGPPSIDEIIKQTVYLQLQPKISAAEESARKAIVAFEKFKKYYLQVYDAESELRLDTAVGVAPIEQLYREDALEKEEEKQAKAIREVETENMSEAESQRVNEFEKKRFDEEVHKGLLTSFLDEGGLLHACKLCDDYPLIRDIVLDRKNDMTDRDIITRDLPKVFELAEKEIIKKISDAKEEIENFYNRLSSYNDVRSRLCFGKYEEVRSRLNRISVEVRYGELKPKKLLRDLDTYTDLLKELKLGAFAFENPRTGYIQSSVFENQFTTFNQDFDSANSQHNTLANLVYEKRFGIGDSQPTFADINTATNELEKEVRTLEETRYNILKYSAIVEVLKNITTMEEKSTDYTDKPITDKKIASLKALASKLGELSPNDPKSKGFEKDFKRVMEEFKTSIVGREGNQQNVMEALAEKRTHRPGTLNNVLNFFSKYSKETASEKLIQTLEKKYSHRK